MARRSRKKGKNPWIAAILNFIIAGLGYIYVGKRMVFGGLLILGQIVIVISYLMDPSVQSVPAVSSALSLLLIGGLLAGLAFAYDAFRLAQGRND